MCSTSYADYGRLILRCDFHSVPYTLFFLSCHVMSCPLLSLHLHYILSSFYFSFSWQFTRLHLSLPTFSDLCSVLISPYFLFYCLPSLLPSPPSPSPPFLSLNTYYLIPYLLPFHPSSLLQPIPVPILSSSFLQ